MYQVKIRYAGRVVAIMSGFVYLVDAQEWADEQERKYGVGVTSEILLSK